MKHRHHDMICAKAANMDLVLFSKYQHEDSWREGSFEKLLRGDAEFFACLPQHKEACLHWLNGGVCQLMLEGQWSVTAVPKHELGNWSRDLIWMKNQAIRIKPRKQERWIAIRNRDEVVHEIAYESLEAAKENLNPIYWSFHEIEIEI